MSDQFTLEQPVKGHRINGWRTVGAVLMRRMERQLRTRGFAPSSAPDLPSLDGTWDGFIQSPYRVLTSWIPDWAPHRFAGEHVVRVDTIAVPSR